MFDPLRTRPGKNTYYTHKGQVIRPKKIYMDPFTFNESEYKKYLKFAIDQNDASKPSYKIPVYQVETESETEHNIPTFYNYISYIKKTPLGNKWHKVTGNLPILSISEAQDGYLASKAGIFQNNEYLFQDRLMSDAFFCIHNKTGNTSIQSFDLETEYCNCPFTIENLGTQMKVTIEYMDAQFAFGSSTSTESQKIAGNTLINSMTNAGNQANNVWSSTNYWEYTLNSAWISHQYVHCKKMEFTVPITTYFGAITMLFDADAQDERTLTAAVYVMPELTVE